MNKDNASQFLPLVQALADGKAIQFQDDVGEWMDAADPILMYAPNRYRIKPEPRKSWYRIAEMNNCVGACMATADSMFGEAGVESNGNFIRWLTDKIHFDVTEK